MPHELLAPVPDSRVLCGLQYEFETVDVQEAAAAAGVADEQDEEDA